MIHRCDECDGGILVKSRLEVDLKCPNCQSIMISEEGHLVHLTVSALPETDTPKELLLRKMTSTTLSVGN